MTTPDTEPVGRPLSFDPEVVLFQILRVFWERGYEHTSIGDIEQATELTRPSLYNRFGNKRAMYEQALDMYLKKMDLFIDQHLIKGEAGLEDLVAFVHALLANFMDPRYAPGCAILNAMAAHGELDAFVVSHSQRYRKMLKNGIEAALHRAATQGEVDRSMISSLFERTQAYLVGLNILTRHENTRENIEITGEAITSAILSWKASSH